MLFSEINWITTWAESVTIWSVGHLMLARDNNMNPWIWAQIFCFFFSLGHIWTISGPSARAGQRTVRTKSIAWHIWSGLSVFPFLKAWFLSPPNRSILFSVCLSLRFSHFIGHFNLLRPFDRWNYKVRLAFSFRSDYTGSWIVDSDYFCFNIFTLTQYKSDFSVHITFK